MATQVGPSRRVSIALGVTVAVSLVLGSVVAAARTGDPTQKVVAGAAEATAAEVTGVVSGDLPIGPLPTVPPIIGVPASTVPTGSPGGARRPAVAIGPDKTTTTLAARGHDDVPGIYVARPDGSGARMVVKGLLQYDWSPDGTRLAVMRDDKLVVVPVDGGGERTIASAGVGVNTPRWSPDGKRIAFTRTPGGLHTVNTDGMTPATLVDAEGSGGSWSPDGRLSGVRGRGEVMLYERDGRATRLATNNSGGAELAWAPDGRRVAYYAGGGIGMVGADGSGARTIAQNCQCGSHFMAWSPAGHQIAVGGYGVRTIGVDGGDLRMVFASAAYPSWSPDGGRLGVIDQSETTADKTRNKAVVVDASGANRTDVQLPTALMHYAVKWAPVGDRVAVVVGRPPVLPR